MEHELNEYAMASCKQNKENDTIIPNFLEDDTEQSRLCSKYGKLFIDNDGNED